MTAGAKRAWELLAQAILALLLIEAGLRLYNPMPFRLRGDRIVLPIRQVYEFDNRGTRKLDPITRHTKNSLGFRGPEPPRDFRSRLTILTIGGSTTEGLFLSDGKTWTDQLARRIAAVAPQAWVNNAGLDGQSTYGHLVLLEQVVSALKPRLALFLIGANDVGRGAATTFDAALTPEASRLHAIKTIAAEHSVLLSVADNLQRAWRTHRQGFGHSEIDLRTTPQFAIDEDVMDATVREHRRLYLAAYRDRLMRIVALCRASQIEPVFITQPALFGETVDPATGVDLALAKVNGRGNGTLEWRLLELYNDVTRQVGATEQVTVVDLARALPKDSTYFYDFLHFTNEGSSAVGDIVFDGLCPALAGRFGVAVPCRSVPASEAPLRREEG